MNMHVDMANSERDGQIRLLEGAIATAFADYALRDFEGMAASSLAGEYLGAATFAALADDSKDRAERSFWEAAAQLEYSMIGLLEPLLERHGVARPARPAFDELGKRTVAVFANHDLYCDWVAPLIGKALEDFLAFQASAADSEDWAALRALVDHEKAFVDAWKLLPRGYPAARAPLDRYLANLELH